jgi:soluble lytic murein transglycosylase-like protein
LRIFFTAILVFLPVVNAAADIYLNQGMDGTLRFSNAPTGPDFKLILKTPRSVSPAPKVRPVRVPVSDLSPEFVVMVEEIARKYTVEPSLVLAVMQAESNFNPFVRSHKGAQGLMQLMPATAQQHRVSDVYDVRQNIEGGVRQLRFLLDRYGGDILLALSAYNAGPRKVEFYGDIPPYQETVEYLVRVVENYEFYSRSIPPHHPLIKQ